MVSPPSSVGGRGGVGGVGIGTVVVMVGGDDCVDGTAGRPGLGPELEDDENDAGGSVLLLSLLLLLLLSLGLGLARRDASTRMADM